MQKGFQGTSTREIAAAAGLRQGSLIHYFQHKHDIFAALLTRMIEPALDVAKDLRASGLPPESQLYRLVHADCVSLASDERNVASLMLHPEARDDSVAQFWLEREKLRDVYRRLIRAAAKAGVFRVDDLELATDAVFGIVESIVVWFPGSNADPVRGADLIARTAIGGLVAEPRSLDRIIRDARSPVVLTRAGRA